VFTRHQLQELVNMIGADHIVMGTDYTYDMAESDPIGHFASIETFDQAAVAALARGNAHRLLRL
jgi:aminocarboxymuconate-semialdehyde decarboxylase